jgi:hypothetical protein
MLVKIPATTKHTRTRPTAADPRPHQHAGIAASSSVRGNSTAPSRSLRAQRLPSAPRRYRDALAKGVQSSAAYRAELGASEVQGPLSAEAQRLLTELYQPSVPTREAVRTASERFSDWEVRRSRRSFRRAHCAAALAPPARTQRSAEYPFGAPFGLAPAEIPALTRTPTCLPVCLSLSACVLLSVCLCVCVSVSVVRP